ncbi:uncharacterized protein LOC143275341 [Babylonia areolata]|uniref:uncharacterized protein LOC143275341 n=1 Tax=Babylonia areolata TaxID=304850 RepID=UPI003FD43264
MTMNGMAHKSSAATLTDSGGSDQRSMFAYHNRIDTLTAQSENDVEFSKEITQKHWKTADNNARCANRACRKHFSFLERPHHCRRCGDVFCTGCLKYRRKLNQLANIDPQGRPYKVCKSCYEEGQTFDGCVRDVSQEFARLREQSAQKEGAGGRKGGGGGGRQSQRDGGWRNRLNFDQECERLLEGFSRSVGRSELRRALHEMRSVVSSVPSWQKSAAWLQESTMGACQVCRESFGLLRKRHFCKVCGLALCKGCSTTDLLVYLPDAQVKTAGGAAAVDVEDVEDVEVQLAIIKIVGCPKVEPEISLYLRVCGGCREELIGRQVLRSQGQEAPSGMDMMLELSTLHSKFSAAETNVSKQLRDYQEITESLENNSRSSSTGSTEGVGGVGSAPHSNMRTLAKAQEDLTDFLAQHVLLVQRLKRLSPQTDAQSRLLKNYIRAKCDFYLENMSTYRQMKRKLSESSPPEVLEFIQRVMDKNAIISAHLYLRQLVYESIHLCDKYELNQEKSPSLLVSLEQVIEEEVSSCLQREGEDVGQHLELMKEMIRTQMKEHKLIRPSRRTLREHGRAHVQQIMASRTREVLEQISLQLRFKSANRSFPAVKEALSSTLQQLSAA